MSIMENSYSGLTVNERLVQSGQSDEFDKALAAKNELKIRAILEKIQVDQPSIESVVLKMRNNQISQGSRNNVVNTSGLAPKLIRYPIIVTLGGIGLIGVIVALYQGRILPLVGPFMAMIVGAIIVFIVKWRRG